jgi:hypothetical protein
MHVTVLGFVTCRRLTTLVDRGTDARSTLWVQA